MLIVVEKSFHFGVPQTVLELDPAALIAIYIELDEVLTKYQDFREELPVDIEHLVSTLRPVPRSQDLDIHVNVGSVLSAVVSELLYEFLADPYVIEHAFQLASEHMSTFYFKFLNYKSFCLVILLLKPLLEEPLAQVLLVEPFENVFVLDVAEQGNYRIQFRLDFLLR